MRPDMMANRDSTILADVVDGGGTGEEANKRNFKRHSHTNVTLGVCVHFQLTKYDYYY